MQAFLIQEFRSKLVLLNNLMVQSILVNKKIKKNSYAFIEYDTKYKKFKQGRFKGFKQLIKILNQSQIQQYQKTLLFSNIYKGVNCQVTEGGKVVECTGSSIYYCLCKKAIPKTEKILFAFQILSLTSNIFIGIGFRDIISKNNYSPVGVGSYMIRQDGCTYSHHNKDVNGKQLSFTFTTNDIIIMEVSIEHNYVECTRQNNLRTTTVTIKSKEFLITKILTNLYFININLRISFRFFEPYQFFQFHFHFFIYFIYLVVYPNQKFQKIIYYQQEQQIQKYNLFQLYFNLFKTSHQHQAYLEISTQNPLNIQIDVLYQCLIDFLNSNLRLLASRSIGILLKFVKFLCNLYQIQYFLLLKAFCFFKPNEKVSQVVFNYKISKFTKKNSSQDKDSQRQQILNEQELKIF
ncbi:unnamed protein product [Paramecium pentaurelia]|uniref:Uncharacterized protein n=1 Tax=Paramecium pentaurelia TaxID=43138 RepID=A0A8S1TXQ9_9CILI|nr:unnamed protein product [Paramecium pentaurelia]